MKVSTLALAASLLFAPALAGKGKKQSSKGKGSKNCDFEIPLFEVIDPALPFGSGFQGGNLGDTNVIKWRIVSDPINPDATQFGNTNTVCTNVGDNIPTTIFNTGAVCQAVLIIDDPDIGMGTLTIAGFLPALAPGFFVAIAHCRRNG